MSDNPYQRQDQLEERMLKASPKDLCLVIRDLTYRSHREKLSSNDTRVMNHAQSFLLDEWELYLGTPREKARREMEWIQNAPHTNTPVFSLTNNRKEFANVNRTGH
jgi:RNA polymerase-interacting CarD/CdnL/TRCF family regulator